MKYFYVLLKTYVLNVYPYRKSVLILILCLFCFNMSIAQFSREKRVYYLDCSYSMVKPNKIWEATKKNLCQAINKLTDETTEIVIVPFAFDSNYHNFLEGKSAFANEEGKKQLCSYINNLPQPNPNTKTFHSDALGDFF